MRNSKLETRDNAGCRVSNFNLSSLGPFMIFTDEIKEWLPWVIKIRFVIITFVFAIDYSIHQLTDPGNIGSIRSLGVAVILWYILSLFFLIYNQLSRDYLLQAYLQIFSDIVIITGIVHVTGDLESNYFSLYLVAIILASILLPRGRAFLVAAVSFVFMGAMIELVYLPSMYPELRYEIPAAAIPGDDCDVDAGLDESASGENWRQLFRIFRRGLPLQLFGGKFAQDRPRVARQERAGGEPASQE